MLQNTENIFMFTIDRSQVNQVSVLNNVKGVNMSLNR